MAIQLAEHLAAHVATTAGTADVTWVRGLGAAVVVDYRRDDFETILRDYDVVLGSPGGETLEKSLRVLNQANNICCSLLIYILGEVPGDEALDRPR
jgi:NADPH:quinone reductase-like Zn-dependent oxidoreductase